MWTTILSFLNLLLPPALQLIGYILQQNNAAQTTMTAYANLIQACANDGVISVATKDAFQTLDQKLKNDLTAQGPKPEA